MLTLEIALVTLQGATLTATNGKRRRRRRERFLELYGWTGLLMITMFLLSAVWTTMLAVIQQRPTWVANVLMDTADLDDGDLWMFTRADDWIVWSSTVFLGVIALSYIGLIGLMVKQSCSLILTSALVRETRVYPTEAMSVASQLSLLGSARDKWRNIRARVKGYTSVSSPLHDNPVFALPKLVLQTVTLYTMLAEGIPPTIILTYASLLFINWMISCYRHTGHRDDPQLVKSRVFFSFDTFFAVFAPLQVLVYACLNFKFDRAEFATRMETLPPGNFDRIARLFVDPTQISLFRIAFQSLQLMTWPSLLIKIVLNVFTVLKWRRIVMDLSRKTTHAPVGSRISRVGNIVRGLVFLGTGSAIVVCTIVAIVSTGQACQAYQHCTVPSYQWSIGSSSCACTVFVDRHIRISTLAEWQNPSDTSANLAQLAAAGTLKVVQIINRRLPTLPNELRECRGLEHLILFFTHTATIPDWASGFTKLKYLRIEGTPESDPLTHLPPGLFVHMPYLSLLHLGDLGKLAALPDLRRLVRLKHLVLALLYSIPQVPGLDALTNLEQLSIVFADQLWSLPSLGALTKLTTVALVGRSSLCCSGFLPGQCDRSDPLCANHAACSTTTVALDDYKRFAVSFVTACQTPIIDFIGLTVASTDLACGGHQYKQCELYGMEGICYPARMQVVSCLPGSTIAAMRRLQIQRGVGKPCDPAVETWLGCSGK